MGTIDQLQVLKAEIEALSREYVARSAAGQEFSGIPWGRDPNQSATSKRQMR